MSMKTLFIGQNAIHLKAVDSTNSYASELLRQNRLVEGTIIYSFEQQNGRGQRGTVWESEPNKNATLSLVLHPTFLQTDKQFLLTKIASLAIADLMSETLNFPIKTHDIKIKWPNDIYVGNKKIAGILIENTLRENILQSTIIGVGLNINQKIFNPAINATSLSMLTNKEFDLMEIIKRFCEFIEARYLQLKTNKLESINTAYLKHLYRLGEWSQYISNEKKIEGKIIGTSASGRLQMKLESGVIKEFDLKEIRFV